MDSLDLPSLCRRAREASRRLAVLDGATRNGALLAIAEALLAAQDELLAANRLDLDRARQAGTAEALVDRLALDPSRLQAIARAVREVAAQPDPVGEITGMTRRPNGLLVGQVRVPLGVVAMIYEARPNVTVDAAALTLKSGNAVLLRGGSDARSSNEALGKVLRKALLGARLPEDSVLVLPPLDQDATRTLLAQTGLIDLVIPRGGERLIRFVTEHARVPVIQHYKGVCHLYVDQGADLAMALQLVENGKTQRPGTCNATECLLVHQDEAGALLPDLARRLLSLGVELRACPTSLPLMPGALPASDADWGQEFLDKILAIKVVDSLDGALDHVARFGSNHSEAICTRSYERSQRWLREVDASCALVNASTRFNDGGELGLGAEIGISTSKLHAYGPMGAQHLTTLKWIVQGEGQIRRLRHQHQQQPHRLRQQHQRRQHEEREAKLDPVHQRLHQAVHHPQPHVRPGQRQVDRAALACDRRRQAHRVEQRRLLQQVVVVVGLPAHLRR
jgi:glutamate-5-semialdehyde dehydrogenase